MFYAMSTGEGERKTANVEGKKKNMWSIKQKDQERKRRNPVVQVAKKKLQKNAVCCLGGIY